MKQYKIFKFFYLFLPFQIKVIMSTNTKLDKIVGNHYRLKKKIGSGSFGEIYEAETIRTHRPVAVKFELLTAPIPQLSYESKLYSILTGGPGIPQVRWFGKTENRNALVIDLLGKSLEDLLQMFKRHLSLKTVLMLADQMLCSLEFIHNKNFIHRDIKPDNFVMGTGQNSNAVFLIDFGLAKKYRDPNTHVHIEYAEGKSLTGTARYASIGALHGFEQSRRDDMESLGYVLIYLMKGSLPWMGLDASTREGKYEKILQMKKDIPIDELCSGLPKEFAQYLISVKRLKFTDKPRYSKYRALFRNLFISSGFVYNYVYDWTSALKSRSSPKFVLGTVHQARTPTPTLKKKEKSERSSNITNEKCSRTTLPSTIIVKDPSYSDRTLSSSADDFEFEDTDNKQPQKKKSENSDLKGYLSSDNDNNTKKTSESSSVYSSDSFFDDCPTARLLSSSSPANKIMKSQPIFTQKNKQLADSIVKK